MGRRLIALAMVLLPGLAAADVIYLKGGGRIEGQVVEERPDRVVVEVSAGQVTLPRSRIQRMTVGSSALAQYRARASRLAFGDVEGWLALASWARDNELATQARSAFQHVIEIDPANAAAHQALGHVFTAGRWLSSDESYRARGYVEFEGSWVRPDERQAVLRERALQAAESRERAESDARIREAEARARAADAETRRLDAEADQQSSEGYPYPYVFGGGGVVGPVQVDPDPPAPPVVVVVQQPPPPRRHGGGRSNSDGRTPRQGGSGAPAQGGRPGAWTPGAPNREH